MIGKIKAAVDTRRDPDLLIIARSDARAVEGLDAAIDRVNAYLEAGADIGFVEAPQTVDELARMGFALGIYPSQTHRAAIRAAQKVLAVLKQDGDVKRIEHELATFQEREEAVGTAHWRALEAKYLGIEN